MTQEEWQREQAKMIREAQQQVKMQSQGMLTPEQIAQYTEQSGYDPEGSEAVMAAMLRGGQDALMAPAPTAQQYGNVVVGPTWSASLDNAAQRAFGGYQIGQSRKGLKDIDEKRALAKSAEARIAAEEARAKQEQDARKYLQETKKDQASYNLDVERMNRADKRALATEAGRDRRALAKTVAANSKGGDGLFSGTGIEAQMLNAAWQDAQAQGVSKEDFMQDMYKQRLGRETTTVTPQGTEIKPGYTFDYEKNGSSPENRIVAKPATDAENRSEYTIGSMREFDSRATDYTPTALEAVAYERGPGELKGGLVSNEFKEQKENAGGREHGLS
jgi:hypothetical protein